MQLQGVFGTLSVAILVLLAGCTINVGDVGGDGQSEEVDQPTATPALTEMATPSATETPSEADAEIETPSEIENETEAPSEIENETLISESDTTAVASNGMGLTWTQETTGNADASVDNGVHTYSVYKCERATSTTELGETGAVTLSFDYELTAEQWWEVPTVEVYVDDQRVFRGKIGQSEGEQIFDAKAYGTASGSINETIQTGGDTEVLIGVTPSNYCSSGDHATTTLTVSDLTVSASNDTADTTTQADNDTQVEWTQNTTGDATATVDGTDHSYSVYKCERATSTTALGNTDSVALTFDYELTAEQWWEVPTVEVYVDDQRVFRGKIGQSEGEQIFDAEAYGTASGSINETIQTGGDTEVLVGVTPSNYCSSGDHATTTFTVTDLSVSTEA